MSVKRGIPSRVGAVPGRKACSPVVQLGVTGTSAHLQPWLVCLPRIHSVESKPREGCLSCAWMCVTLFPVG